MRLSALLILVSCLFFILPKEGNARGDREERVQESEHLKQYDLIRNHWENNSGLPLLDFLPDEVNKTIYFDQKHCISSKQTFTLEGESIVWRDNLADRDGGVLFQYRRRFASFYSSSGETVQNYYFTLNDTNPDNNMFFTDNRSLASKFLKGIQQD
ncbi:MAG: hypothetical protein OXB84_04690, partial [Halobacteriovoraceae bacterium]|nr:hypothetical protein [Halobacteriovoraceae bacterium]